MALSKTIAFKRTSFIRHSASLLAKKCFTGITLGLVFTKLFKNVFFIITLFRTLVFPKHSSEELSLIFGQKIYLKNSSYVLFLELSYENIYEKFVNIHPTILKEVMRLEERHQRPNLGKNLQKFLQTYCDHILGRIPCRRAI